MKDTQKELKMSEGCGSSGASKTGMTRAQAPAARGVDPSTEHKNVVTEAAKFVENETIDVEKIREEQRLVHVKLTRSKVKGGRSMHKDAMDATRHMENGARDASTFVEFDAMDPGRITR